MKVISYCLFDTVDMNQRNHRGWDIFKNDLHRYWYNIPAMYIINSIIYKEFETRVYISESITNHEIYPLLTELSKNDNFKIIKIDLKYNNTEPTMWRMMPYWDDNVEIVLCRDIDSLPSINEIKATKTFIETDYSIHTMRTHSAHNNYETRLLAGLCGFKPSKLTNEDIPKTFDEYYNFSTLNWGCDQNTLIEFFYKRITNKQNFLDSPISTNAHTVSLHDDVTYIDFTNYEIGIDILNYIDQYTVWSGEPIDFRGDKLSRLLEFDYKECDIVKTIMRDNPFVKNFYMIYNV